MRRDETAPRVTFYDDEPGPTKGERIELSAKVLANWVAKAGNLLQEEFDAAPGTTVGLDLPAQHWRTLYWAMAVWSVGATVVLDEPEAADVLVADSAREGRTGDQVVVTLAGLARMHPNPLPDGVVDEAAQLSTYADHFDAWEDPAGADVALSDGDTRITYDVLVPDPDGAPQRTYVSATQPAQVLQEVLRVWAGDGSVVLVRDPDPTTLEERLRSEGVTDR